MPKPQKYKVILSKKDRDELEKITSQGKTSARVFKRAQILIKADQSSGCCLEDQTIADMLRVSKGTSAEHSGRLLQNRTKESLR